MPIDPSIALQGRGVEVQNPLDAYSKALTIKELAQQTQLRTQATADDQAMRSAFARNLAPGPDGSPQINRPGVLSDLMKSAPMKVQEVQNQFRQQDLADREQKMKTMADTVNTGKMLLSQIPLGKEASDQEKQEAWVRMKQQGSKLGLPNNESIPDQFPGDDHVKTMLNHLMTAEEQLAQHNKDREFGQKDEQLKYERDRNQLTRNQQRMDRVDKLGKDFNKDMDPDASRTGNFGQISARIQAGERMKTLIGAFANKNLPPAQIEELALGSANMISGTTAAARAQVEALVPKSAMGDASKIASWIANDPYGANQQKFVEMMEHTVDREMDTANRQLNDIRAKRVGSHEEFRRLAPDQYAKRMSDYGMDPKTGKSVPPPAETHDYNGVTYVQQNGHWVPQNGK
jgi:hypothetical protein